MFDEKHYIYQIKKTNLMQHNGALQLSSYLFLELRDKRRHHWWLFLGFISSTIISFRLDLRIRFFFFFLIRDLRISWSTGLFFFLGFSFIYEVSALPGKKRGFLGSCPCLELGCLIAEFSFFFRLATYSCFVLLLLCLHQS